MPNAKQLIAEQHLAEADVPDDVMRHMMTRGPGAPPEGREYPPMPREGGPRRMGRPGPREEGPWSHREKMGLTRLLLLELWAIAGRDPFYKNLVDKLTAGQDPSPEDLQHFLDEAGNISDEFSEGDRALMNKVAQMAQAGR